MTSQSSVAFERRNSSDVKYYPGRDIDHGQVDKDVVRAYSRCVFLDRCTCSGMVWVYLALGALALTAIIVVPVCAVTFGRKTAPEKGYLPEYKKFPGHEIYRPGPYAVLNDTDLEQCAANCSTNDGFECLHVKFCPHEGTPLGTCHLFRANTRLRSHLSHSCDIYTRGDPAEIGIPHGGASSLKTGFGGRLSWILLCLVLAKIFVA
ncbi:uncharacterized protein LOC119466031 isoform X2 [Dermacentor silvarum]|uniref:uncharacterized protein LOC119466031 isoform X2 n=1 Tax=Dermacentor silvarum TaxID=543639 RepID=UPI0021011B0A|nr:uncharacterized protein LOC119466031 isoform X2 [Dermacentor silvarum]